MLFPPKIDFLWSFSNEQTLTPYCVCVTSKWKVCSIIIISIGQIETRMVSSSCHELPLHILLCDKGCTLNLAEYFK